MLNTGEKEEGKIEQQEEGKREEGKSEGPVRKMMDEIE